MSPLCLVSIALLVSADASRAASSAQLSPIGKVVKLIEEMRAQTEKDADADKANYEKYNCWCTTNGAQKEAAIAEASKQIGELTSFVQEAAAKEGELKTDIGTLEKDIAEDKDALASATEVREKENKEFAVESADLTETKDLLGKSVAILGKVQLTQVKKEQAAVLLQTHNKVTRKHPNFIKALEKDLFDVLGSMQPEDDDASFAQEEPKGAAAGAKSYNSQSGEILGVIGGMKDKAESDLAAANKAEQSASTQFDKLKKAKVSEISTSTDEMEKKKADLASTMDKAAKAKEDIAALEETRASDEKFLENLKKNCAHEDAEYKKRLKIRSEEIRALGETLKILTDNESRELFGKTISLVQVEKQTYKAQALVKITALAKRNRNMGLLALALKGRVSNSKFDQVVKMVKEAMDKMIAQMKAQKEEEARKIAACKNGLTEVEEQLADAKDVKANLDDQHANIKNGIEKLSNEIEGLKKEIEDMKVSLKQASEGRKEENLAFQTAISDNRATIMILNKALARLKQFYQPKSAAFVEIQAHQAPPPAPSAKGFQKSAGAGGVLQLLNEIILEAEQEGMELDADEKRAQGRYAELVQDTKDSIEAASLAIQEKGVAMTKLEGDKSETEESQLANSQEIESFEKTLAAHHADCDFLLKWGPMRQAALEEEMDSTQDAEATLSGADMH